ncbi:hypothetical protein [Streptomyces sp. NPDC056105]|uniref:hypothetical protein n=1 Tax=Streptomyces sp. NPDC056105 TaxID=3345714 RepID=UPI0035D54D85
MSTRTRTDTPDEVTIREDGTQSTRVRLKRACNGCGQSLGDVADWDIDEHDNLTDVRGECKHCQPLVDAEAAGARTWQLLPRNIASVDNAIDRYGVFAKGYWQFVDGMNTVVGLRIGTGETRVVAFFGDWIIRWPDGKFTVHAAPKEAQR